MKSNKWTISGNSLTNEFTFKDFNQAFEFMTIVSRDCKRLNHHPSWSNTYNKVSIKLSTHDSGGVTEKDFELAKLMDQAAANIT